MFDRKRPPWCVVTGGKFQILIQFLTLKTIKFEFPALSDDDRPSFLIKFVRPKEAELSGAYSYLRL